MNGRSLEGIIQKRSDANIPENVISPYLAPYDAPWSRDTVR